MERSTLSPPLELEEPTDPLFAITRRRVSRPWWRIATPWTLYRYVILETIRVLLLGVVAVSLLYTVVAAFQIVRSGLQLSFVWPLLTKTFAYPLYYSIPLAFLFAITLALGRMVADLEVAALRTHGVSHVQLCGPFLLLATVLCGVSHYLNGWVVPGVHYEKRNLQAYILKQLENLGAGVNRTLLLPDGAGTLWVGEYEGTRLWRVDIDLRLKGRANLLPEIQGRLPDNLPAKVKILAREGQLELNEGRTAVFLKLRGVDVLVPEPVQGAVVANERFHQKFSITENVVIPLSFAPKSPSVKDRTQPQLLAYIRDLREEIRRRAVFDDDFSDGQVVHATHKKKRSQKQLERTIATARTEFHRRLGFSLACLTFPLVGIALTLLLERWNRLVPFFLANLVVIALFYPLLMVGVSLGKGGFFPPLAMALPNLTVLALGVFLFSKVLRK